MLNGSSSSLNWYKQSALVTGNTDDHTMTDEIEGRVNIRFSTYLTKEKSMFPSSSFAIYILMRRDKELVSSHKLIALANSKTLEKIIKIRYLSKQMIYFLIWKYALLLISTKDVCHCIAFGYKTTWSTRGKNK